MSGPIKAIDMEKGEFTPKLFTLIRDRSIRKHIYDDMFSGVIVGIVALPLAIAFAIASGVSPQQGLITAIVAGFIVSAFGGSRVQIGGPTGAFIVIVYGIVQEHGVGGLSVATVMAGFILIGMGFARFGSLLKFIPYPLIVGFTSGIALIIFSSQIKDLLGLKMEAIPVDFVEKWIAYAESLGEFNIHAVGIAFGTIVITLNFQQITNRIPGSIVAIVLSTLLVQLFQVPVETIESRFGDIPAIFTMPGIPDIDYPTFRKLIQPALAIALLGGIESLLSAVVADGMIGGRHRSNMELVAQGAANIFSSLFGGIPATGAIARTATNVKNGGRTPVAGIVHAITLLVITLLLAPYAKLIPLACLAGILVVVSYHMGEWHHFFSMLRGDRLDVPVLLTTFILTVFFDLVIAIEVGMVLSSFIFMKRMSDMVTVRDFSDRTRGEEENGEELFEEELSGIPEGITLYEINGPLFFGAAHKFNQTITDIHQSPGVMIIRMRRVPFVDATGMYHLKEAVKSMVSRNVIVIMSGVNPGVRSELEKADIHSLIGRDNILSNIGDAIKRAKEVVVSTGARAE
jgi:SulP family sulfate permease